MQRHTAPADVHNCRRIDSQCQPKIFQEPRSEVPQPVSPSSELCLQRAPADLVCSVEHVQSVGKPAINVQRHRVAVDSPDCGVLHWDGMAAELFVKRLTELNPLDEPPAARVLSLREHGGIHNLLLNKPRPTVSPAYLEGEAAAGNSLCLFPHSGDRVAAGGNIHPT